MTTPYLVLEIPESTPHPEIRKAYYKVSLQHHPDKGGDASRFRLINAAYHVLNNRVLRASYHAGRRGEGFQYFLTACQHEGTWIKGATSDLPASCAPTDEDLAFARRERHEAEQERKRTANWAEKEQDRMDAKEEREEARKAKEAREAARGAHRKTQEEKNAEQRQRNKQTRGKFEPRTKARCALDGKCWACGKMHTSNKSGSAKKKAKKARAAEAAQGK